MIVIAGAGPSGIMSAISAASNGNEVILLEKNALPGRKLLLTGGGRCNLTNVCPFEDLTRHYFPKGDFLRDAFNALSNKDLLDFFKKKGLRIKVEENGRVFPVTDKASSVLDVLMEEIKCLNVKFMPDKSIKKIISEGDNVTGIMCLDGSLIESRKIILATGGVSYKKTGSTGDGIKIAEELGHRIEPLTPGLVSINLEGSVPKRLEGISLDSVRITFRMAKSRQVSAVGSLIFTKTGVSGPIVLASSRKMSEWMKRDKIIYMDIDMFPFDENKGLEKKLLHEIFLNSSKSIKNILKGFMPVRFIEVFLESAGVHPDKKANQVNSAERKEILDLFKGMRFTIAGLDSLEKAQVTCGGVSIKDIDPRTMESRLIKGLYFAGEMIDIDGECGGFNLQSAFSTGYLAGKSASE